jgi:hypothetical protein
MLNKKLNTDFVKFIENTNNVCLYKLGNQIVPKNLFFPKVNELTLINCNKYNISNILEPKIFPNLQIINYLSMSPNNYMLYKNFSSEIKWIFPDKNYDYYNFMVKSGYGKKDSNILNKYIANKRIIDGQNGFDISYDLDINIPDYGIVNGEWWQKQIMDYLEYKYNEYNEVKEKINQEVEEKQIEKELVKEALEIYNFEDILI